YQKLADEIRSTFTNALDISGSKLASCLYLQARLSPLAPGILWRVGNDRPFIIDGHMIPPGTKGGMNTYSTHHNEK
ncbi:hypothetical protein BGZ60DRAFT_366585, partial [Tricladium varicosporioides]